ncbi:MAG TPA: hypothetical protein DEO86_06315 [Colwellia sp.]|nr:hypothetical protein [Colwellia sp.]|tara:strand:+ start:8783 stop:9601 length:819 start_codon:yes stop_codon:yes gene_type:complete
MSSVKSVKYCILVSCFITSSVLAHDPIFSLGPHVLFKEGIEVHGSVGQFKNGNEKESEQAFEFKYGLTGDWVAGIELPYKRVEDNNEKFSGVGDLALSTKYRFWRKDTLAEQESAAVLLKVKWNTSSQLVTPDAVDTLIGLTYGFESLKWYRWASVRYRDNGDIKQGSNNLERGNKTFIDLVVGYRPVLNGYRDPDMVYMVELNGEYTQQNRFNGARVNNSGGSQWFISPGFMWTLRNMAIKGGIQLPIHSNLNGEQQKSDYRFKLSIEWHM